MWYKLRFFDLAIKIEFEFFKIVINEYDSFMFWVTLFRYRYKNFYHDFLCKDFFILIFRKLSVSLRSDNVKCFKIFASTLSTNNIAFIIIIWLLIELLFFIICDNNVCE